MKTKLLISTSLILALSACGGSDGVAPGAGSGTAPPPPPPATGSSMPVTSSGAITGFGSIIVNDVHYELDNGTVIAIEGQPVVSGDDSALRLGMRVRIEATESGGQRTADRIEYDDDLRGPARNVVPDGVDPTLGVFTVNGQTVTVDGNTVFDDDIGDNDSVAGIDIRDLAPANFPGNAPIVVEVSGFPSDAGILASRIDRVNAAAGDIGKPGVADDELEVKGFVDDVAADGSSLTINDAVFLIDSNTMIETGLVIDDTLIGVFVEVKADEDAGGNLIAVSIEREDEIENDDKFGDFEIEGLLQSVDKSTNPHTFTINGTTVEAVNASSLIGLVGSRIKVRGMFAGQGQLVIQTSDREQSNSVRTEDRIVSVDNAAGSFTTRLGLIISPDEGSRVEDDVASDGDRLTPSEFIARLMNDDHIKARGFPTGGGINWTRVEREDTIDRDCRLRGRVADGSIADPVFVVEGVTIDTTGGAFGDFRDDDGVAIGPTDFFNMLSAGDVVSAHSDAAGVGCANGQLSIAGGGYVKFERNDGVKGNDDDDDDGAPMGNADAEVAGTVANLDTTAGTFTIGGRLITVNADTLFDDSIVEAARGVEIGDIDLRLGDIPETLGDLLSDGDLVEVQLGAGDIALLIED